MGKMRTIRNLEDLEEVLKEMDWRMREYPPDYSPYVWFYERKLWTKQIDDLGWGYYIRVLENIPGQPNLRLEFKVEKTLVKEIKEIKRDIGRCGYEAYRMLKEVVFV